VRTTSTSPRSLDDIPANELVVVGGAIDKEMSTESSSSWGNVITILLVVAAASICLVSIHSVLTKPVNVGVVVRPGTIKSKCGIMGWVPPVVKDVTKTVLEPFQRDIHTSDNLLNCVNEYLEVNHQGELKIIDKDGNTVVHLKGTTCDSTRKVAAAAASSSSSSCVKGVIMQDNRTVKIGSKVVKRGVAYYYDGKRVTAATSRNLSPWPFVKEPKVNLSPSKRKS
jgi:hypothetical protein